jgi:hypothetical protein
MKNLQTYFPHTAFSIWDLFKDEKIKVFDRILAENMNQARNYQQQIYNRNYNLLLAMSFQNLPIPSALQQNLQNVISQEVEGFFERPVINTQRFKNLVQEVIKWKVPLNKEKVALLAANKLYEMIVQFEADNSKTDLLEKMDSILTCLEDLKISPRLNEVQDVLFKIKNKLQPLWDTQETLSNGAERQRKIFSSGLILKTISKNLPIFAPESNIGIL